MLKLKSVSHDYGQGAVLADVTLELAPGRVLALTGPSGCGKSTLLHMAAGLLTPGAGEVENTFRRTACVFQEPRLLPWRTARANIAFGLKALGMAGAERRSRAEALAARLGLADAIAKYPHQLSGGMRQRVALGRALAVEPDLLLLDEPFGALDAGRRAELQEMLLGLLRERGLAALLVTHDVAEAERLGDELVVLSGAPGRVLERRIIQKGSQ
ncbi:MAG TPA: ATP-binding cassette domain-containing protein [Symbiobacteriaceae bacterium]|nr:ATP-binding cassette domain-containing protein [Symbiobacteriaceae bacterium]